ncbi:MAG: hypothetical protein Q8N99_01050 [Nanoarchaeota archaeon]|nr:hypothetical protein [Nanoarchaeota archaeon]
MKKSVVIGVIAVVILVIIIFRLYFILNKKLICSNINTDYCNKSCGQNSDCVFICGCGAISKEEKCKASTDIECEIKPVECKDDICQLISNTPTCAKAGEELYKNNKSICCQGLKSIAKYCTRIEKICSDCGNNVCENWENICNCPEDCLTGCRNTNISLCNMSCKKDGDCKFADYVCGCININETMQLVPGSAVIDSDCGRFGCKCINNKCVLR